MSDEDRKGHVPVEVRIAGHEYKIRSDGDADRLREIAGYVDRAMDRVRERTGTVDSLDVAVLTCLNLGREILALREARTPPGSTAVEDDKLRALIDKVEAVLPAAARQSTQASSSGAPSGESDADASASEAGASEAVARTLELPSVEALRERDAGAEGAEALSDADALAPQARVAAGGRDRAS